jgi:hypothetical protein
MFTQEQFEKTYMHKENVMTYEQYVAMENHTSSLFKVQTVDEYNKNFVEVAEYNKAKGWSNE